MKAEDIVRGWTQGLGRYARTEHHFKDVAVTVQGDSATATFNGMATHVKANGERWSCGGDYVYRFARTGDGWRAVAAKFDMKWEQGTR
ncbi:MAG: hypothetical protein OHK0029_24900 [Armatimonadaceae bacterium]